MGALTISIPDRHDSSITGWIFSDVIPLKNEISLTLTNGGKFISKDNPIIIM